MGSDLFITQITVIANRQIETIYFWLFLNSSLQPFFFKKNSVNPLCELMACGKYGAFRCKHIRILTSNFTLPITHYAIELHHPLESHSFGLRFPKTAVYQNKRLLTCVLSYEVVGDPLTKNNCYKNNTIKINRCYQLH